MNLFAERLKELRKEKKVTQVQMAAFLEMTCRNYQRYEAGAAEPNLDSLIKIADYFGVSLDYLLGRSDEK